MGPLQVVLIDASPADRALVARELRRHLGQASVREVQDSAALEAALSGPMPDLVVTDHGGGWNDGVRVIEQVKAAWRDCPVVVFTDGGDEEVAVRALKAGADDYVVKGARHGLALAAAARAAIQHARDRRRAAAAEREREQLVLALRQALEARDRFLTAASHELRNPLNSLVLQLEALARVPELRTAPGARRRIERARVYVRGLVATIESLVDVAQVGRGEVFLVLEPVDLVVAAKSAVRSMGEQLEQHGCEVNLAAPPSLTGDWDRARVEHVLRSLLSNAAKFGHDRPIDVVVREEPGGAAVTVADRGIGIASADQRRIFERFERAVSERHHGGFGLGLWVARELVAAMGGRIDVESAPGRGAAFTVHLPRRSEEGA